MSDLPKGWVKVSLGEVVDYGFTIKSEPSEIAHDSWLLELEDIEKSSSKLLNKWRFSDRQSKSTKNRFLKGDVLYGKLRPYLDKVIIADEDGYCTTEIIPIKPNRYLDNRFIFYSLKTREFLDYVNEVSHGLSMPRLGISQGKLAPFTLAPLNEQIRIADKLDEILAKVNQAQVRLEKIPSILKRFRQSVLAAATSGDLTREWREGCDHQWPKVSLKSVGQGFNYGSSAKSKAEGDVPVLRMGNLQGGKLDWDNLVYTSDEVEIEKYLLEKGDVLFNRTNSPELVGKTSIYRGEQKAIYAGYLIRVKGSERLDSEFLNIQLNSPHAREYCWQVKTDGVSQSNINAQKLQAYEFDLPEIDEQLEIVRRVSELFSHADLVERQYLVSKKHLDSLTQSILAKAFCGKLVPQDPTDEPAGELLKRIASEVTSIKSKKKTVSKALKQKNSEAKVTRRTSKDSLEQLEKQNQVDLETTVSKEKDSLRLQYQSEINRALSALNDAKFSVEQFRSVTGFSDDYSSLKALIMNLLKGIPNLSEPLLKVDSWDSQSGGYLLRLLEKK